MRSGPILCAVRFFLQPITMRFSCIITFRSSRSSTISTRKTEARGPDHMTAAADTIARLKKRQRQPLTIVGVMVYDCDAAAG